MHDQPWHNTPSARPIATQFRGHRCIDNLITEHSFDSQATRVFDVLGLFYGNVIHGCLYNQALADVQSTGEGIRCL